MDNGEPSWWNDERVAELKLRVANNESFREIAIAMHATSRNAVIGKAQRLKLVRPVANITPRPKRIRRRRILLGHMVISEERCGLPVIAGMPYCAAHCRMAYAGNPRPKLP